ncbi:hypothetical protein [Nocardia nova]|uniref:hypothetical protein n=1 Tax=Nocardia nova TaxID=37330 RepID=UPI0033EC7CAD
MSNPNAAIPAFRLTPTETALLPVIVALVGIVVTAIVTSVWNYRTLDRAEERYNQDRRDKYTEAMRTAIVDVVHQSLLWHPATADVVNTLGRVIVYMGSSKKKDRSQFPTAQAEFVERRSNWETRTSDLKRSIIAADFIVADTDTKEHLKKAMKAVESREQMVYEMIRADSNDDSLRVMGKIMLSPAPLGKIAEELIRQAQKSLQDREGL